MEQMVIDPINAFLTFIGLIIWPSLTVTIIIWKLGHPLLAILAFLVISGGGTSETVARRQIVVRR